MVEFTRVQLVKGENRHPIRRGKWNEQFEVFYEIRFENEKMRRRCKVVVAM